MEQQDRILGYFLEEASEHLTTIEQGLRRLPETVKQPSAIRELFRAAHSIKGSAAMLGLRDIQTVGNRFEANFKLLKDNPQLEVDNHLQSLFLGSFGFLQAAIEQVRTSSDPYRQDPATPDPVGDPVFEELRAYLQQLLAAAATDAPTETASDSPQGRLRQRERDPAIEQVFGEYVSRKLAEIVESCQQADTPATRTHIQQICQKLGKLGENFEYLEWTNLFTACRLAVANPSNSLDRLGEIISVAVKQAQVLVLADRDRAITITPDLEAAISHPDRLELAVRGLTNDTTASLPLVGAELGSTWNLQDLTATATTTEPIAGTPDLLSVGSVTASGVSTMPIAGSAASGAEFDADAMELNEFMNLLSDEMPTEGAWMQDNEFFDLELPTSIKVEAAGAETTANEAESTLPDPAAELALAIGSVGDSSPAAEASEYDEETFFNPDLGEIDERDLMNFWSDVELGDNQVLPLYSDLDPIAATNGQLQPDLSLSGNIVELPAPDFSLDRPMSELFPAAAAPDISDTQVVSDDGSVDLNSLLSQTPPEAIGQNPHLANESAEFHPDLELLPIAESSSPTAAALELQSLASGSVATTGSDMGIAVVARESVEPAGAGMTSVGAASAMENRALAEETGGSQVSEAIVWEDLTPPAPFGNDDRHNPDNDGGTLDLIDWIDNSVGQQDLEDLSDLNLDLFVEDPGEIDLPDEDDVSGSVFNSITMSSDLMTHSSDLESAAIGFANDRGNLADSDLSPIGGDDVGAIAGGDSSEQLGQRQDFALDLDPNVELQSAFGSFVNSDLGDLDLSPLTSDRSTADLEFALGDSGANLAADLELALEDSDSNLAASIDNAPAIVAFASEDISDLNLNLLGGEDSPIPAELGDVFVDLDLDFLNTSEEPVGDLSTGDAVVAELGLDNLEVSEPIYNNEPLAVDLDLEVSAQNDDLDLAEPTLHERSEMADFNLDVLESTGTTDNSNSLSEDLQLESLEVPPSIDNFEPLTEHLNLDIAEAIDNQEPFTADFNIDNLEVAASIDNQESLTADLNLESLEVPPSIDNFESLTESLNLDAVEAIDSNEPFTADFNLDNLAEPSGENVDFANIDNIGFDNLDIPASLDNIDAANIDNLDLPVVDVMGLNAIAQDENLAIPDLDALTGDLDLLAANDASVDLASDEDSNLLDLNAIDLDSVNVEPLSIDLAAAELNDLSLDLDNLSAAAIDLDNLEIEQSGDNLAGLDDLLGVAALGVGGAVVATGIAGLDDLDALVGTPAPAAPGSDLNDLDALLAAPAPTTAPAPATPAKSIDRKPKESRKFDPTMRVSVRHLDNLNNLVGELVVNRNTLEQDQNRMRQFVEKLLSEVQKLNEVGKRMQDLYERSLMENSLIASRQQSKSENSQIIGRQQSKPGNTAAISAEDLNVANSGTLIEYDPLEMDRFTPIHLLSQKMIELTVRVRESTADIEFVVDGSTEVTRTLRQITGQLQEDITKSRMQPFAQTADRLQRGVRDTGLKCNKEVELTIEGRDTPIDKVILDELPEPLTHMANNAIAHGIESPETRIALGKPAAGKITLRAIHQGNQTIISMSDDGAGIDTERVKRKAIEKGIITQQQAINMPDKEAYELLFLPSFSTKDQADELSGRGVGMDVVKTKIDEIRGTITTESQLGVGTTFTIRLPLALSIAKALIAVNEKNSIAFPMDGIEDTQDVSPEQIQTNSEGQPCIFWRDELMPFQPLSELLEYARPISRNTFYSGNEDDSDLVSILILRSDGQFTAVQVDKITGDREIVIKPLQGPAAKPLGIAGATVLGDGRIVPIADVMELIALTKGTLQRHVWAKGTDTIAAPTVEERESSVLIVDDSITVRELLSLTFKRAGYRVEQARDGQEAWDKLRAGLPCDIVFCDIEMPRMDGLEFLSRIQKDTALSKVPVAMLTSRGSDRHRQIASQLGASGYFIKPYLEEALLDAAKRMIKGEVLEIV